jgi:succinyl-CoA synthetase beta subunit
MTREEMVQTLIKSQKELDKNMNRVKQSEEEERKLMLEYFREVHECFGNYKKDKDGSCVFECCGKEGFVEIECITESKKESSKNIKKPWTIENGVRW